MPLSHRRFHRSLIRPTAMPHTLPHARSFFTLAAIAIGLAFAATQAQADQTRNATANNLNLGTAWVSGTAPGSGDVALWDSSSALSNTLGANLTWAGINISSASGTVAISGTHTLSAGAINLGAQNLSLTTAAANNSLNFSTLTGSGILTLSNGTAYTQLLGLTAANSLNFTGRLELRGGNATASADTVAGSWLALGATINPARKY